MFNNNLKYRILNLSFKMRYFYAPPIHSNELFLYSFFQISIRSSNLYL